MSRRGNLLVINLFNHRDFCFVCTLVIVFVKTLIHHWALGATWIARIHSACGVQCNPAARPMTTRNANLPRREPHGHGFISVALAPSADHLATAR